MKKEIKLTKKETDLVLEAVREVRNGYTGSGRFSKKGADSAGQAAEALETLGLKTGRHFERGNDAPKGGWSGEFCKLTAAGKRIKAVRVLIDADNIRREKEAEARKNDAVANFPEAGKQYLNLSAEELKERLAKVESAMDEDRSKCAMRNLRRKHNLLRRSLELK
jgi:hypothetical protein